MLTRRFQMCALSLLFLAGGCNDDRTGRGAGGPVGPFPGSDAGPTMPGADAGDAVACVPSCGSRVCGPDPVCGASCGSCAGTCTADGTCSTTASGPRILAASASGALTPTTSVTISVVVTDPDGIADVVGGQLLDEAGRTYATFATSADEGAYEERLTWSQLHRVESIQFNPGGATRTFIARFFDAAGNSTDASIPVELGCDDPTDAACGGSCVNLLTDEDHCGACATYAQRCIDGVPTCYSDFETCDGICVTLQSNTSHCGACGNACDATTAGDIACVASRCVYTIMVPDPVTCDSVCAGQGVTCLTATGIYGVLGRTTGVACDQTPRATINYEGFRLDFRELRCRCE